MEIGRNVQDHKRKNDVQIRTDASINLLCMRTLSYSDVSLASLRFESVTITALLIV